ncbi:MAG: hypothetical protein RIR12_213 [Bacteroidota bacterium]|jgi:hypothetical protein
MLCFISSGMYLQAQLGPKRDNNLRKNEMAEWNISITKAMEDKVIEVVKPVKEKMEALLKEDRSGNFEAYSAEVLNLGKLKNIEEKNLALSKIQKKYYSFIKSAWQKAGIDESLYQQKLKNIFPPALRETIRFTEFLNFSISGQNTPPAPPPPPPAPSNLCIDALTHFFNLKDVTKTLNANADVLASQNYIRTGCGASIAGYTLATGAIISDLKIPGTFAGDDKMIRINKTYVWRANATAVSVLGCSFATIATTTESEAWDVFIRTWAPVIFISSVTKNEVKSVQTKVKKSTPVNIRFGVQVNSSCFAEIAAGSFADSICDNLTWSECEE